MLQLNMSMYPQNPGFEVKAIISFSKPIVVEDPEGGSEAKLKAIEKKHQEKLARMHEKLEKILPGNFKARFTINSDDLIVICKTKNSGDAQGLLHKVADYIRSAAFALKIR